MKVRPAGLTFILLLANNLLNLVLVVKNKDINVISLDLECEYNLHIYGEHLCLIQIDNSKNTTLIDALKIEVKYYKQIFENRNLLKEMYDASMDMSLLRNNYNVEMKSILDLKPAVDLLK